MKIFVCNNCYYYKSVEDNKYYVECSYCNEKMVFLKKIDCEYCDRSRCKNCLGGKKYETIEKAYY